jgi:hypothetical protein
MEYKRAIYIGPSIVIEGYYEESLIYNYGLTGVYLGNTFIPDDVCMRAIYVLPEEIYISN